MFKKTKKVGEIHKTVTDWDSIFGVIFMIVIGLVLLGSCSGG